MRAQTSITLISLLLGSVAVGLYQIDLLTRFKQVSPISLLTDSQSPSYFAHRGSGRIEGRSNPPFVTQAFV